ncbi:hypothetical protein P153DRAFT_371476 [Dothidotthia symphoricarpi CBS 119687]|uniref:Uncharacterized protein n=1 Tax=Dothidotthia symphoricarpi CBS 119687 TaxID=1392245 RepID=A0A6A5ZY66_9PLEO|nr:uncharacterized protein P153DRAFT_371476 [Dothidotthia symphoricarpi CBS 119687]KAF2123823.1 hypothetical protein P153DRAFT_371476 [Dothidotthia symphoricarpi CBS 119687]
MEASFETVITGKDKVIAVCDATEKAQNRLIAALEAQVKAKDNQIAVFEADIKAKDAVLTRQVEEIETKLNEVAARYEKREEA